MMFIILIAPVLPPACILQKKLTERRNESLYILIFSHDRSCGHFSVQQRISLASDFREWWKVEWKRFLESLCYWGVLSPYLTLRNSHSWILAYHKELFFSVLDST